MSDISTTISGTTTPTTTTTTTTTEAPVVNQSIIDAKVLFTHPCSGDGDRCDSINGCVKIEPTFGGNISVKYKPYVYTPEMSKEFRNTITLPRPLLNNDKENILISVAATSGSEKITLDNSSYTLSEDNMSITIHDDAYSNTSLYYISYIPGINISHLLPSSSALPQQIIIPSIVDAPNTSKITFNYTYQDIKALSDNKYYSPICKNYTLTLS